MAIRDPYAEYQAGQFPCLADYGEWLIKKSHWWAFQNRLFFQSLCSMHFVKLNYIHYLLPVSVLGIWNNQRPTLQTYILNILIVILTLIITALIISCAHVLSALVVFILILLIFLMYCDMHYNISLLFEACGSYDHMSFKAT